MKKLFASITDARLNPNQLYVLYCIHNGLEARFVNIHLEMRALRLLEYIDKNNKLTPQGLLVLENLCKEENKGKNVTKEMIQEYQEMWPNIKLNSGKYARGDKSNLDTAFKWFLKTYDYSWATIIKATALYLDEYEAKNWEYMRTSQYFIRKGSNDKSFTSDLADYCSLIESGAYKQEVIKTFKDKVV